MKIISNLMRLIGNTAGDGSGTDYRVLVNALGEILTSTRAARATLLDGAAIAAGGVTSAAHITSLGHSMFIMIESDDVCEFAVISSPDNVDYYKTDAIAVNEAATKLYAQISNSHEYIAVRNDSPDTRTATIILGTY